MSDQKPPHTSVLAAQILRLLAPNPGGAYLDGTLGAGGHSELILQESAPDGTVLAFDLDPQAIQIATNRLAKFGERVRIINDSYKNAAQYVEKGKTFDGILLDLGVSSMQLDQPECGFSFQAQSTLDMRFGVGNIPTAQDLVNTASETELAEIIYRYGEEPKSRQIAAAIVRSRESAPITTTLQLAEIIKKAVGHSSGKIHPATRSFQAFRIAVNDELNTLSEALPVLVSLLRSGGLLAVISFHSLEDRIVKQYFRIESTDCLCPSEQLICTCDHKASLRLVTRRAVTADAAEIAHNIRARSAKLRVAQKI